MKNKLNNIELKKKYGQNFLRDNFVVENILKSVKLNPESSVFEIGCGDGFLTGEIIKNNIERLWVFEIDKDWAEYTLKKYSSHKNLTIFNEDILALNFDIFKEFKNWTLIANLPYQITFPIIYKLINYNNLNKDFLKEGIIMVQEEVAQKIVKKSGKKYGFNSIYLQHFFQWQLLYKISPTAFYPEPKIFSRLLYFKPRENLDLIKNEEDFWVFIKRIFSQPRRNLKNNLKPYHYNINNLEENLLNLRAQQLGKEELVLIWNKIIS